MPLWLLNEAETFFLVTYHSLGLVQRLLQQLLTVLVCYFYMYYINYAYYIYYAPSYTQFTIMQIIRMMIIISSDNSPSSHIGAARFSLTQGSFHSVQLIKAGTHQVHGCAADILQPVSCQTILLQSRTGSCLGRRESTIKHLLCCWRQFGMLEYCFVLSLW